MARALPNILITGTPGSGKTTTAELLASALNFEHIEVGKLVKEKELHDGFDSNFQSYLLIDEMEPMMVKGGIICDHHDPSVFPERWFDLVVCLTCSNTLIYDRLSARGYHSEKIQENVECEIMRVVLDEAAESYKPEILIELPSDNLEQMESNVEKIVEWVDKFNI